MNYVMEKLYLGGLDDAWKIDKLQDKGISHILTVESKPLPREITEKFSYKYVYALDMESNDLLPELEECIKFIEEARQDGGVLVHCYYGQSRSATVVLAYLMQKMDLTLDDAQTLVMKQRPQIRPNHGFLSQLELFEEMGNCIDRQNEKYKKYRLAIISTRIQQGQVLDAMPENSMSPDPFQNAQGAGGQSVYKCRKCRRNLFRSDAALTHNVGAGSSAFTWQAQSLDSTDEETLCTQSLFIEPVEWMCEDILVLDGKLCCPKCQAKLGSFTWTGERCPCGTWVTPAFHIQISKVDHCKLRPHVQYVPKPGPKLKQTTDTQQASSSADTSSTIVGQYYTSVKATLTTNTKSNATLVTEKGTLANDIVTKEGFTLMTDVGDTQDLQCDFDHLDLND